MMCRKCDEKDERIKQLEAELYGTQWDPPLEFRLTRMEAGLLRLLFARDKTCTHEFLMTATRDCGGKVDFPISKTVDAKICHLRRKLRDFDLKIETVWGVGYRLSDESRDRLNAWPAQRVAA